MAEYEITGTKQITELPEATAYEDGMYYAVAKAGSGTKKINQNVKRQTEVELEGMTITKIAITNEMLTTGYFCDSTGEAVSNSDFSITPLIAIAGNIKGLKIKAPTTLLNRSAFCIIGEDGSVLYEIHGTTTGSPYGNNFTGFVLVDIPEGAAYIRTSIKNSEISSLGTLEISYFSLGEESTDITEKVIPLINGEDFSSPNLWDASNLLNGYYDASGTFNETSLYKSLNFADISGFDYVICTYDNNYLMPIVYDTWDAAKNLISGTRRNKDANKVWTQRIDVTDNVKFLTINTQGSFIPQIIGYNENPYKKAVDASTKRLSGKKISFLGDSITTYAGWIPEGNETYYTGSNCGVSSVNQTWWKRLINYYDLELVVNESWSGATISDKRDSYAPNSSGVDRCENLNDGDKYPDIIIIYMGTNDFRNNVQMGTYDGSQTFPQTWATFRDAVAVMLKKILTKYPTATTYICTLKQFEHYNDDNVGFPDTNGLGLTTDDYTNAILDLATLFGVPVIDFNKSGLNYFNLQQYTGDYSAGTAKGLHPNAAGHAKLANRCYHDILNNYET